MSSSALRFGKITTSLVNDVFMPLVGLLIGGVDLGQLNLTLKAAVMDGDTVVKEPVTLGLGTFLSTIIDFILVAFVIFLVVKAINQFHKLTKKEEELPRRKSRKPPPPRSCSPRSATCWKEQQK